MVAAVPLAFATKATYRPLALIEGSSLKSLPGVPSLATETSVVNGVQPDWLYVPLFQSNALVLPVLFGVTIDESMFLLHAANEVALVQIVGSNPVAHQGAAELLDDLRTIVDPAQQYGLVGQRHPGAGQAGAVTSTPSVWAASIAISAYLAPERVRSGASAG